jgi:hypothetical protein
MMTGVCTSMALHGTLLAIRIIRSPGAGGRRCAAPWNSSHPRNCQASSEADPSNDHVELSETFYGQRSKPTLNGHPGTGS